MILVISALCGKVDFVNEDNMQSKINKFKEILDSGVNIGVPIVTIENSNLPEEYSEDEGWSTFLNTLCELCPHTEKIRGVCCY